MKKINSNIVRTFIITMFIFAVFSVYKVNAAESEAVTAGTDVAVNSVNFPDETFRKFVKDTYDKDNNGILSAYERQTDEMNISNYNISSLKGIEYFTQLRKLECARLDISTLDVSGLVYLQELTCFENPNLTNIKFGSAYNLVSLTCYNNNLDKIDTGAMPNLRTLYCNNNNIEELDVTCLTKLTELGCGYNNISSLDLSRNTELVSLYCNNNRLTSLNTDNIKALHTLYCSYNSIKSLDVSRLTGLNVLHCEGNGMTSLSTGTVRSIVELNCFFNKLTSLDIGNMASLEKLTCSWNSITSLDTSANTGLKELYCYQNNLKSLDVSCNAQLTALDCSYNAITSLSLGNLKKLGLLDCSHNNIATPDVSRMTSLNRFFHDGNVKKESVSIHTSPDKKITYKEYSNGNNVDLSGLELYIVNNQDDLISATDFKPNEIQSFSGYDFGVIIPGRITADDNTVTIIYHGVSAAYKLDVSELKDINKCSVTISGTQYNYDGKAKTPAVTVKDGTKTLVKDRDYKVAYSGNVKIGTGSVTVNGKGDYKGSVIKKFNIVFGIPQLSSADNTTNSITIKWGRITGATGYIVYRKTGSGAWGRIADIKSGSTTSYADKTAKSNTTYTYTVRAYNSKNTSGWNSTKTIKRIMDPTLTSAVNTTSGIQIKWNKAAGATGYIVYRRTGSTAWGRIADIKSGLTVSYTDTTAQTGTVYTYTVRAYSGSMMSYWHSTKQLRRLADPVLSTAANVTSGIDVKWASVKGATGYIIYRKSGQSDWSRIADIKNDSITSYTDKTAKSGNTYSYTIRAYNGSVMSFWHGAKSIKRLSNPNVTAAQVTSKGVNVKWTKVTGATGYIVYRCTKYGSWSRIADIKSGATLNYLDKNVKKGIKYIYTVRAYSGSTMSGWNSIKDAIR